MILLAVLAATLLIGGGADARTHPLVPAADVTLVKGEPPGGGWEGFRAAEAGGTIWYTADADAWDLAHEMGHAFDEQELTDSDRRRLSGRQVMRTGGGPWITGDGGPDECFADWYANARLGQGPGFADRHGVERWDPGYTLSTPTVARYRRFLRIVNHAARR